MGRIKARVIGILIAVVIIFAVIPLLDQIVSLLETIPSWAYWAFCFLPIAVVVLMYGVVSSSLSSEKEKATKLLDAKMVENPVETGELYNKLLIYGSDAAIGEICRNLFGGKVFTRRDLLDIGRKSIELQVFNALVHMKKKMDDDPETVSIKRKDLADAMARRDYDSCKYLKKELYGDYWIENNLVFEVDRRLHLDDVD